MSSKKSPSRRTSGFPFNLLEAAINWVLLTLDRAVYKLVSAAFSWLDRRRRR
jgi:hypothetical protein